MNFLNSVHLFVSGTVFRYRLNLVESLVRKSERSIMLKCGLSLIRFVPNMNRITSVFSRIWTESEILSIYGKIRSTKAHILVYFKQYGEHLIKSLFLQHCFLIFLWNIEVTFSNLKFFRGFLKEQIEKKSVFNEEKKSVFNGQKSNLLLIGTFS